VKPLTTFTYATQLAEVVFGAGSLTRLPAELDRLGLRRALVVTTPEQSARATELQVLLGERMVGAFTEARMHVPIATARAGRERAKELGADCTVAFGGGSTIGLGKAIALDPGIPQVAIDTTYAGSSRTPIWGITEDGQKKTGNDPRVLPRLVIFDPLLTYTLPPRITAASGLNAMAHAVEALYSPDANPIVDLMAEESLRALGAAIPRAVLSPEDHEARSLAHYGAFLAGSALGAVGMALHHKLCHTLGGSFDLPHAETHAAILPHVVRYNERHAPEAIAAVARALGTDDAAARLFALLAELKLPMSLRELGLSEADLDKAADLATQRAYFNPRPVDRASVRRLLGEAFAGRLAEGRPRRT
jgi:maleylacetate reductase